MTKKTLWEFPSRGPANLHINLKFSVVFNIVPDQVFYSSISFRGVLGSWVKVNILVFFVRKFGKYFRGVFGHKVKIIFLVHTRKC